MESEESRIFALGLTEPEVKKRQKEFGENSIHPKKKTIPLLLFLGKFKNPLFILMIGISALSFFLGEKSGAIFVLLMVFMSALLDFLNTYKSQKTVEKLVSTVATTVQVIREGKQQEIMSQDIVPGDIVFLSAGNVVPADCRVLKSDDFFLNQASLTGESLPVEKAPSEKFDDIYHAEDLNVACMGTSVVSGFAYVQVIKIGVNTQFGKITQALGGAEPKTDFEKSMTKFGYFITKLIFYLVSFVFFVYLVKNYQHLDQKIIVEAFTFALAITLGVMPDMLPAIITVCLSKGSSKMAKKDVIVKHLASIENFGSMDILCTDKTGTLTQDKISLVKYLDYAGNIAERVLEFGFLSSHFHTGVQNPLDSAIENFKHIDSNLYKKIEEIPYDFTRKRSSVVVEKEGKKWLICKGAPEEILRISSAYELNGKVERDMVPEEESEQQFTALSADGFRVLAVCYRELPAEQKVRYGKDDEKEMIFLGFLAFLDPPKEDVQKTLDEIRALGIEVKILTGDNEILTQKICRDIGFAITGILTGKELEKLNDEAFAEAVLQANVFARVTPDLKEKIITTLKNAGKVVGFLGDGINDAPALKAADVGISVNNAVDIAKETADIILLQKNLESLKEGIVEGRKIFHNTMKYVLMGLSSNFGNMFSMMGAVLFLPFLPMLPAQILFNNFVYDISQLSLPTDAVDSDELLRPAHWDLKFIRKYMMVFGWVSSVFDFLTFYLLYFVYHLSEHQFQSGWFIESIATQVLVIYVIRTKKIPFLQSRPSKPLVITTLLAVIFCWIVPFTALGAVLSFDPLPVYIMTMIAAYVLVYLILMEFVKRAFYKWVARRARATV